MNKLLKPKSQRTYERVFQHPITHNLEWGDVRSMFKELGEVEEEHNGNIKVTVAGHALIFQPASGSDVASADQVSQIRRFIRSSQGLQEPESGLHLLVVINHAEARIFRAETKNSIPELVVPYDPDGHKSHVHSSHDYEGPAEHPNNDAYFQAVTHSLKDAEKILIFGSGTGSSATMNIFVDWLKTHNTKLADRVIAAVTIDQGHLTEAQLLAKARDIYSR